MPQKFHWQEEPDKRFPSGLETLTTTVIIQEGDTLETVNTYTYVTHNPFTGEIIKEEEVNVYE